MKFVLVLLAVLGLSYGKVMPKQSGLNEDFQDFLNLVPADKVVRIVLDHLANDPEFQLLVEYVRSDDFKNIILTIEKLPAYIEFLSYLQTSGFDVYGLVNTLHELLALDPLPIPRQRTPRHTKSLSSMVDEIFAVMPHAQLKALFREKLRTSTEFQNFYNHIHGPEFQSIVKTLVNLPEYQELKHKLRKNGIDVDKIVDIMKTLFGLYCERVQGLAEDLQDFLDLIPMQDVFAIVDEHLKNDSELIALQEYIHSEEFKTIVYSIDTLPAYHEFLTFLENSGLKVYEYVNKVHDLLKLPHTAVPHPNKSQSRNTRSLSSMLDEIVAILPREELKALFQKKLRTRHEFKQLFERLRSDEFHSIIRTLHALPEYQSLLQCLRDKGIDVDVYITYIRALIGMTKY